MMHFDETGKYVKFADMHNSESYVFDDHLLKRSSGVCRRKCSQYRSPTTRYENNQKRCKKCDIFITLEGTKGGEGLFCKCCNLLVSNGNDNDSSEKKSAPVYEEIDESVKTFYEFKDFLDTIKLQANYQLVMLKELIEYGPQHKGEIAESLAYFNNKDTTNLNTVKYYFDVPVYDVLLDHGFIIITGYAYHRFPIYKLNVSLSETEKFRIFEIINDKLNEYNKLHEISENEFPNSDNRGNIEWDSENSFEKFPKQYDEESSKFWREEQEKIAKDTSEGVIGKIYRNLTRKIHTTHSKWIWSVTPENWEILKSQNVWGSRIGKERIGEKVQSGDQVAFYVIGTSNFKGIFEFVGDWYDSPGKTWNDDLRPDGSLIYVSQIQIKPIQLGSVKIHTLHEKLDVFIGKSQNNRNLVLQGGSGYPSNNSKPLSGDDFTIIRTELMRNQDDLSENSSIIEEKTIRNRIKFSKSCPKCAVTRVTASLRQEFEEKIEESFGYRSNDPDNSDKKIPQSWCRGCRSSQNQTNEKLKESDSLLLHICSDCKETKIEGIPGLELDKKIEEFFGTKPSYLLNSPESRKINPICRNCRRLYSQDYRTKIKNEMIDQELEKLDSISDVADTKIFNFDDGEVNIQNCKILSTDTIKKDQILTNDEIISTFKVGNMGGIRYTKYNNVIVLLSTHSDDYDDSMDLNSGFIIYTGEGKGDQEIKNGNEKILNSQNTPMVYFKEVYQEPGVRIRGALDNKYKFIGVVKYHKYNWATEKGRKVIKFVLEIVS